MKYSSINPVSCVYKINSLLVRMTCMTYRASTGLQRNNKILFNKLSYLCEIRNTTALLYIGYGVLGLWRPRGSFTYSLLCHAICNPPEVAQFCLCFKLPLLLTREGDALWTHLARA